MSKAWQPEKLVGKNTIAYFTLAVSTKNDVTLSFVTDGDVIQARVFDTNSFIGLPSTLHKALNSQISEQCDMASQRETLQLICTECQWQYYNIKIFFRHLPSDKQLQCSSLVSLFRLVQNKQERLMLTAIFQWQSGPPSSITLVGTKHSSFYNHRVGDEEKSFVTISTSDIVIQLVADI